MIERDPSYLSDEVVDLLWNELTFSPDDVLSMPPLDDIADPKVTVDGEFGVFTPNDVNNAEDEQRVNEKNQLLLDIIGQMPDEIEKAIEYQTAALGRHISGLSTGGSNSNIKTMVWARRAAYRIAGENFDDNAYAIHEQFGEVFGECSPLTTAIKTWLKDLETSDPDLLHKLSVGTEVIAEFDREKLFVMGLMAASIMEITYHNEVEQLKDVDPKSAGDETLPGAKVEPKMRLPRGLAATSYTEADLLKLPIEELLTNPDQPVDPDNLADTDIRSFTPLDGIKYDPQVITTKGELMQNALRLVDVARDESLQSMKNAPDTLALADLINHEALKGHVPDLHWVRHLIFDAAGVSFDDHARDATQMYSDDNPIPKTTADAQEWLKGLEEKLSDDHMSHVLDVCFEFICPDLDKELRRLYRSVAAVTLEQVRYYQKMKDMTSDTQDENSELALEQLANDIYPVPYYEPAVTGPEYERLEQEKARLARIPTPWPANELLHNPRQPYDEKTNQIIYSPDEDLIEPDRSEELDHIISVQKIVAASDKEFNDDRTKHVWYSERMAEKLAGAQSTKKQLELAHRVRSVVFEQNGISNSKDDTSIQQIEYYFHRDRNKLSPDEWVNLAHQARQIEFENQEEADEFEATLSILTDTPEHYDLVRNIAYLTKQQINEWKARQTADIEQ